MNRELISQLHAEFEQLVHTESEAGVEFWLARDLQHVLGYTKWENFANVIERAVIACETAGYNKRDHFLAVRKMVPLGSGAERPVEDFALTLRMLSDSTERRSIQRSDCVCTNVFRCADSPARVDRKATRRG